MRIGGQLSVLKERNDKETALKASDESNLHEPLFDFELYSDIIKDINK